MAKTVEQIREWLQSEIDYNQPVVDGEEVMSDGTGDIILGRSECAESLLKWIDGDRDA